MRIVKYGMEGYIVKLLQYALTRAGLDAGNLDGIYGRRTAKALQQFQRGQGLAADGIAGKLTWAALFPYICGYTLHQITLGDTIPALAQAYGVDANALKTANPALDGKPLPIGEAMVVPLDLPVVTDLIPYSCLLTALITKGLSVRYPFIRTSELGHSVMGQRIVDLSIGSGKQQIGLTAVHRADEWIVVPMLLRFLEEYAAAYAADGALNGVSARELYDTVTLRLVPLVNPDGADLLIGAVNPLDSFYVQASALAAYYPDIPFPDGWRSNMSGVDLDLQYPTGWETARRIWFDRGYIRPGPRNYAGSGPLITPESRAMVKWARENDFARMLSCRTHAVMRDGFLDWYVETFARPAFIVEAGTGEGPLPSSPFESLYPRYLGNLIRGITLSP